MIRLKLNFQPKPHQKAVMQDPKRHRCVVMARRSGKTVMLVWELLRLMLECKRPHPVVAYIAPFQNQAKRIAWAYLSDAVGRSPSLFKINAQELSVTFLPTGGKYLILGADRVDVLRGIYLDAVAVDELADCDPGLWDSVLSYCLADRKGRALMSGTPRGRMNLLYDLSRKPADDPDWSYHCFDWQVAAMVAEEEIELLRRSVSPAMFAQEMECSFDSALIGAIYGSEAAELQRAGRYTTVRYDRALPVYTAWDLGFADSTAIIYLQRVGSEIRCIDCEEFTLTPLPEICRSVKGKEWAGNYGGHYGPHDLAVKEYGSGRSRYQIASDNGIEFEPSVNWSLQDGIEAVRTLLPHLWIDQEAGDRLLQVLCSYQFQYDTGNRAFKTIPLHNWASHMADALRMFAVANDAATLGTRGTQRWLF